MEMKVHIEPDRPREERYRYLIGIARQVIPAASDACGAMSLAVNLICACFPEFFWVGFYRAAGPDRLVLGPYRGTLPCVEIPFSKGVCGAAASSRSTVIVPDVTTFDGYIACDSASRSEIVVPVIGGSGELLGVLDIDSDRGDDFHTADKVHLEELARIVAGAAGEER